MAMKEKWSQPLQKLSQPPQKWSLPPKRWWQPFIWATTKVILATKKLISVTTKVILATEEVITAILKVISGPIGLWTTSFNVSVLYHYTYFYSMFLKENVEINTYIHTPTEINILFQAIWQKCQPPGNELNKMSNSNLYPPHENKWWSTEAFFIINITRPTCTCNIYAYTWYWLPELHVLILSDWLVTLYICVLLFISTV